MVEEVESGDQRLQSYSNGGETAVVEDEGLINNVYTAAAYGDMEKLQRLVESEGCSVSEPDALGYYALQWAALNNRVVAAQYIIEVRRSFVALCMCELQMFLPFLFMPTDGVEIYDFWIWVRDSSVIQFRLFRLCIRGLIVDLNVIVNMVRILGVKKPQVIRL